MLIYVPSSLSVPDMEGSTSDSIELSQDLAPSVTWKTKFLRPQSWLTILKKADWMTRLFGPISRRLILARSGAELMQSWADTLASRSLSQGSEEEQKTQGICGHTSQESLTLFGQKSASLKTSGDTFDWDCQKCLENSDLLATELGRAYSQRRKSAPRTGESASLSWPTASARDYKDTPGMSPEATNPDGSRRDRTDRLPMAVYWGTPRVTSNGGNGKDRGGNKSRLEDQVHQSFGQVALENHSTNGKNPEPLTANSIPPGSPS